MEVGNDNGQQGGSGNTDPGQQKSGDKSFTQGDVDRIVQERLAKSKSQLENTQKMLDDFKKNKTLTEEQQQQMQEQISHLERTILTKEELSAKEKKELQDQLNQKLKDSESNASRWKNLFETSTIEREIFDACRDDAFDPQQFIQLLSPKTKLIEEVVDGKATGRLKATVSFQGQGKDGNAVDMELSVRDTVKEMKKMTGKYGNLFKSGLNSGVGGNNDGGTGTGELTDDAVADHESYMKNRQKIKDKY